MIQLIQVPKNKVPTLLPGPFLKVRKTTSTAHRVRIRIEATNKRTPDKLLVVTKKAKIRMTPAMTAETILSAMPIRSSLHNSLSFWLQSWLSRNMRRAAVMVIILEMNRQSQCFVRYPIAVSRRSLPKLPSIAKLQQNANQLEKYKLASTIVL